MSSPAETYERERVPAYFGPLSEHVVARAEPRPGEHVVDIACGTGTVARKVAPLVGGSGRVVGLDLSPAMLAVARASAEREGRSIEWFEGRAEALPFPDESFDLAVCEHGLQFVPDKPATLREMRRVLRHGGRVVVTVPQALERHPLEQELGSVLEARFGITPLGEAYSLSDAGELKRLLDDAGLHGVDVSPVTFTSRYPDPERFVFVRIMAFAAAVPSLREMKPEARDAMVRELGQELMPQLQDYIVGDALLLPAHVFIARGLR